MEGKKKHGKQKAKQLKPQGRDKVRDADGQVAETVGNGRSSAQYRRRYNEPWTDDEDAKLMIRVRDHQGAMEWSQIAAEVPGACIH